MVWPFRSQAPSISHQEEAAEFFLHRNKPMSRCFIPTHLNLNWSGDALGAENQVAILMDGNNTVQANFSSRASLQVLIRGAGKVNGLADLGSYPVWETASLAAVPADGWEFSGWSGAVTGTNPTASILMDTPKAVTSLPRIKRHEKLDCPRHLGACPRHRRRSRNSRSPHPNRRKCERIFGT